MNKCLVYTKPYGGTNLAWAGHGKARVNASSTSSEDAAAERAAEKFFVSQGEKLDKQWITCEPAKSPAESRPGWKTWEASLLNFEGGSWSEWQRVEIKPCSQTEGGAS